MKWCRFFLHWYNRRNVKLFASDLKDLTSKMIFFSSRRFQKKAGNQTFIDASTKLIKEIPVGKWGSLWTPIVG